MKATIGTALIAAALLLAGCNKDVYEDTAPPASANNKPPQQPDQANNGDIAGDPNMQDEQDAQDGVTNKPKAKPAKPLADNFIKRKIIGVWKPGPDDTDSADLESVTIRTNGTFTIKFNPDGDSGKGSPPNEGTWNVSKGFFIVTQKQEDGSPDITRNKVLRLDDKELSFQEEDASEATTLHKQ